MDRFQRRAFAELVRIRNCATATAFWSGWPSRRRPSKTGRFVVFVALQNRERPAGSTRDPHDSDRARSSPPIRHRTVLCVARGAARARFWKNGTSMAMVLRSGNASRSRDIVDEARHIIPRRD